MVIFKCPYCGTEYEMTTAHLSFKQRSYAKCQVGSQTMYSLEFPKRADFHAHECVRGRDARHPTVTRVRDGIDAPLVRSSVRELGQELLERRFSRSVSGLNGFITDR